jgi:hypothetical protein
MSAKITLYCDAEGCEAHGSDEFPGWLYLTEDGDTRHFCNGDCLFKWAGAHSEPPTIIHMDEPSP